MKYTSSWWSNAVAERPLDEARVTISTAVVEGDFVQVSE
jgi:hypothetical protein